MRDKIKIDLETGLMIDVVSIQQYGLDIIETPLTEPLYKPKWTGGITEDEEGNQIMGEGEWVEGATQEEIDELTKPQPHEPTVEERLAQTEELLQTVTMAFTEYVFAQDASDDS